MDQESFRRLLQTPRTAPSSSSTSRGSLLATAAKLKKADASKPAFKPRKLKKQTADSEYRDRAAERREGQGNDYAQVEAVLEDFEKRNADNMDKSVVEEQRRYLGGDKDHTVLVKGLDMALVQQYKAKEAVSTEDDDSLEKAFLEASKPAVPRKRTREDIVQELKAKRAQGTVSAGEMAKTADEEARLLEEAKKQGKFKPIGWKPVGGTADPKKKKTKGDAKDGERKKKKRKVDTEDTQVAAESSRTATDKTPPPSSSAPDKSKERASRPIEMEPEPMGEDFDIFADAGDYQGLEFGDDDEEGEEGELDKVSDTNMDEDEPIAPRRWIDTDEYPIPAQSTEGSASRSEPLKSPEHHSPVPETSEMEEGEEEQPMRLQPLASSAVPSIKDLLAMDQAAASWQKKQKKKDKKKAGGGKDGDDSDGESKKKSTEAKVDRDYKRLKSYTEKKAGGSSAR